MSPGEAPNNLLPAARLAYFTPVREHPPLGDRKATVILAAEGLLLTALLYFSRPLGLIIRGSHAVDGLVTFALLVPLIVLLLLGAWHAFRALVLPIPQMPPSLAHFPRIASCTFEEYEQALRALSYREALRHMLDYNYSLAVQSRDKYRLIERSMACLRGGLVLWIVLLLRLTLRG